MNTAAYDKGLPCLNPHCKSHGKPHPNCRCYGLAEGGEVFHFCQSGNSHNPDCEYYKDGGEVPSFDDMPSEAQPEQKQLKFDEIPQELHQDTPQPVQNGSVPSFDQLPNELAPEAPVSEKPYSVTDAAKSFVEGASQGAFSDLAKVAQVKMGGKGDTLPEIEQRATDYPGAHLAGKVVGFIAGPNKIMEGASILKTALTAISFASANNVTKALLDQPGGDPKEAVANSLIDGGIDALMYTITDGLFSGVKGVKSLQDTKIVKAAEDALINLADKPVSALAKVGAGGFGLSHLPKTAEEILKLGEYGYVAKIIKPYIEKIIEKPLSKANAYVGDAVLNGLIKTDFLGIPSAIRYAQKIAVGESALNPVIEGLFKGGSHEIHKANEKAEDNLKKWINSGGIDKEVSEDLQPKEDGFAKGGEIKLNAPQAFAKAYPAQNMMLSTARARVSGYLNSIRPQPEMKLPFDTITKQTDKNRQYDRAVRIAANPLSVLNSVHKGSLTPDEMKDLTQMYPEVYEHISNKMTKRIVEAQLKGEKPSYKKRQSMSLFLGADLDSTFSQQAIAAVQGVYAMRNTQSQAMQPQQKPKKSTAPLSKLSPSAMTDAQARTTREQNQKS